MNRPAIILGIALLGLSVGLGAAPASAQRSPNEQAPPPNQVNSHDARLESAKKWARKYRAKQAAQRRQLALDVARQRARANAELGANIKR